jgi:dienelactone hydrolase
MIHGYRYALLAAALLAAPTAFAADASAGTCAAHSTGLIDALARGDYTHAGKDFSPAIAAALDADKLQQVWTQVQGQVGSYRKHAAPARQAVAGHSMVVTRLSFADMPLDALVACDADGRISTFRLVPPATRTSAHTLANGVHEQPLAISSPLGPLPGVLTLPAGAGPFPAVVMVAGSGPNDADETVGPNKPFRDIAAGLAAAGVASLRYDKRTLAYAQKSAANAGFGIDDEVTDDAVTAAKLLAQQPHIDARRVFVLGHSLGAMMAPRIGERDPQLAGLVMLAASARPIFDVIDQQVREQSAKAGLSAAATAQAMQVSTNERKLLAAVGPGQSAPQGKFHGMSQAYWLSWSRVDPVAEARTMPMPMLFLQGGSDFQVSPRLDFGRWKQVLAGRAHTAFHLYPGLSHMFMPAGKTGTFKDYMKPAHVDVRVISDMAAWIKAQAPAAPGSASGAP